MIDYEYECVKVRVQNGIAWTALNRPEKRNANPTEHNKDDGKLCQEFQNPAPSQCLALRLRPLGPSCNFEIVSHPRGLHILQQQVLFLLKRRKCNLWL